MRCVVQFARQLGYPLTTWQERVVRCRCGRCANKQGKTCCQMCWIGYGTHSRLCRKINGGTKR